MSNYNKAFGPFFDLWIKTKQTMQTAAEVMDDMSGSFEEMEDAVEPVAGIVGLLGKGLKLVVMTMVMGIGIALALMMGLALLGGGMGGLGDMLPGIGDSLGRIFDGFMDIGTQIMSLVGIIFSMDFMPIIEPLIAFGVGALSFLIGFAEMWVAVAGTIIGAIVMVFQHLADSGALQALIGAIGGLMDSVIWAFSFIAGSLALVGVDFESVTSFVTGAIMGFVNFLISSGIIDFIVEMGIMLFEVAAIVIKITAIIIGVVIVLIGWLVPFLMPIWNAFVLVFSIATVIIMTIVRLIIGVIRIIVAIFSGDFAKVGEIFSDMGAMITGMFSAIGDYIGNWVDYVLDFFSPLVDAIEWVIDGVGSVLGSVGGFFGFASGGIARGPESGHMAMLHGTEAVVPLPDGSSIPVTLKGMGDGGGGSTYTANINVSGGGNAREIAAKVSQEVQRSFRTRSRSGGYGRGVV